MPSLVREDRDGGAYGEPAVAPAARPGSRAPRGEALNASKREAAPKMRPGGPAGEHGVDRAQAKARQRVKPSATNRPLIPYFSTRYQTRFKVGNHKFWFIFPRRL